MYECIAQNNTSGVSDLTIMRSFSYHFTVGSNDHASGAPEALVCDHVAHPTQSHFTSATVTNDHALPTFDHHTILRTSSHVCTRSEGKVQSVLKWPTGAGSESRRFKKVAVVSCMTASHKANLPITTQVVYLSSSCAHFPLISQGLFPTCRNNAGHSKKSAITASTALEPGTTWSTAGLSTRTNAETVRCRGAHS